MGVKKDYEDIVEEELEEEDIYSEDGREEALDSDEITAEEEAFMQGYEED